MKFGVSHRTAGRLLAGALVVALGCNDGPGLTTQGLTTLSNPTALSDSDPTNDPSDVTATAGTTSTSTPTTGEANTEPVDPTTVGPSTTTDVDPTTTSVDPSTTAVETTGMMTSNTSMTSQTTDTTTDTTTGEPPPKDDQPETGLYADCLMSAECDAGISDGCFSDNDPISPDGYCAQLCTSLADCDPPPQVPAVQICVAFSENQKICALKCMTTDDCPTGMNCVDVNLPVNQLMCL